MSSAEVLDGAIERVTFRNADSGYSVLRLRVPGKRDPVTAVGNLGPVSAGESATFTGQWIQHPDFGPQFQFETYRLRRPATAEAIEKYFASGVVPGVGPAMARRLVAKFGAETLLVVEHQPSRLREIPGIGSKRVESIRAGIQQHRMVQEIALFLQTAGVSPAFADRLHRHFGDQTIEVVTADPYALIQHVRGIGFRTADQIALSLEVPRDAPARLSAGVVYTLSQAVDEGH
ncbi:MAG: ATP-dependent RecD-like DNA helicase, partial [Chloroflexi bacterium]|nr:ATP-dependent RecD-like DNA helicase [Chloroflexota bacterium]